jgi:hypothetical protein
MLKVGDKVKILPTILSDYPGFPYVGIVGRVCDIDNNNDSIAVEFSHPHSYLHDCDGKSGRYAGWYCCRKELEFIPDDNLDDNLPDIWEYI